MYGRKRVQMKSTSREIRQVEQYIPKIQEMVCKWRNTANIQRFAARKNHRNQNRGFGFRQYLLLTAPDAHGALKNLF